MKLEEAINNLIKPSQNSREVARLALGLHIGDCLDMARSLRDEPFIDEYAKEQVVKELADALSALYDLAIKGTFTS